MASSPCRRDRRAVALALQAHPRRPRSIAALRPTTNDEAYNGTGGGAEAADNEFGLRRGIASLESAVALDPRSPRLASLA